MSRFLKTFVIPLLVWEAIVAGAIALMYAAAHRDYIGPEGKRYLTLAAVLGFVVVLLSWPLCRMLRRLPGTLAGFAIGFVIPIVGGSIWGLLADQYQSSWGHSWTSMDAWFEGVQLSVPSAIAGAIVGLLQAQSNSSPTHRETA